MTTQTLSPALQISSASTWRSRLRALGPGILMASAAIGGSHLVVFTQAGALYGWQLALIIVLTNLFKYPFFRFSAHYTLDSGKSLIEGVNFGIHNVGNKYYHSPAKIGRASCRERV